MRLLLACALVVAAVVAMSVSSSADGKKSSAARAELTGVGKLAWGQGRDCTFAGTMTALANYLGDKVTYDYLMGTSGMAFRVQKWAKGWCPSAACAGTGHDAAGPLIETLGYKTNFYGWFEGKPAAQAMAAMRKPMMVSIDAGFPVQYLSGDDGLIIGYADSGKKLLCRTYFDGDKAYTETKDWPWCMLVVEAKAKPRDRKEAVKGSLKIALEQADQEVAGDYFSGQKAYSEWTAGLSDESRFSNRDYLTDVAVANGFSYAVLCDCRASAARYLESVQDDLGPGARSHILKAAALYREVSGKLAAGRKYVAMAHEIRAGRPWTRFMRKCEVRVLQEVAVLDRSAVEQLRLAYKAAE